MMKRVRSSPIMSEIHGITLYLRILFTKTLFLPL
jgi:hypothetical protein